MVTKECYDKNLSSLIDAFLRQEASCTKTALRRAMRSETRVGYLLQWRVLYPTLKEA